MINKYSGIILVAIAILSLFASWMMYKKYTKNFYVSQATTVDSRELLKKVQIKKESFDNLKVMSEVVDRLSQNKADTEENISIALSPYSDIKERPIIALPTDLEKKKRFAANVCRQANKLEISMSFVTDNDRYAVIADKFVREGGVVGKNYKVMNIYNDKVKLSKSGVNCLVKVSGIRNNLAKKLNS